MNAYAPTSPICVQNDVRCATVLGCTRFPRTSAAHTTEGSNPRRPPAHPVGDRERTRRLRRPTGVARGHRVEPESPPAQQTCLVIRGWELYVSERWGSLPTVQRSRRNSIRKGRKGVGLAARASRSRPLSLPRVKAVTP